jgi:hypothetical protein
MMLRVAWRSLLTRPIRAAVLAGGFGLGIGVMAELLGVGDVILQQARAPALQGGGDLVVTGIWGPLENARFVLSSALTAGDVAERIKAASPTKRANLYLMTPSGRVMVSARGGVPSLEKALGDPETGGIASWVDAPGDERWARPDPGELLRAMDRFHPIADAPRWSSSWAEWLYFNARSRDGRLRLYLTFMVGPRAASPGKRVAGVRLQLDENGRAASYSATSEIDEATLLEAAPDIDIAGNRVRLQGLTYHIDLALPGISGELALDARAGRSMPPVTIRGAEGWLTGYVVPVLTGTMHGSLRRASDVVTLTDAPGYHDHNWGFWEGVRWQWGQVAHEDLSFVYGRVFPPADVADPDRMPGFLAVLGPEGPLGFSTSVNIEESADAGRMEIKARAASLVLDFTFEATEIVRTPLRMTATDVETMKFFQMGGQYQVEGRVGSRQIDFKARGSAETFRK